MNYEDLIFYLRYAFRFGFLFVAAAFGLFITFINFSALSKVFIRAFAFFLIWFIGGLFAMYADDLLPEWERICSLMFNCLMIYLFGVLIFKFAFDYKSYEINTEMPERPSDIMFQVLKTLPRN